MKQPARAWSSEITPPEELEPTEAQEAEDRWDPSWADSVGHGQAAETTSSRQFLGLRDRGDAPLPSWYLNRLSKGLHDDGVKRHFPLPSRATVRCRSCRSHSREGWRPSWDTEVQGYHCWLRTLESPFLELDLDSEERRVWVRYWSQRRAIMDLELDGRISRGAKQHDLTFL
jgi:hypothetical protein